jgi:hypothetical protein
MDSPSPAPVLEPEDYYFDGPLMVFTAAYHLKRGACCGSHCRHCPYGLAPGDDAEGSPDPRVAPPPAGGVAG